MPDPIEGGVAEQEVDVSSSQGTATEAASETQSQPQSQQQTPQAQQPQSPWGVMENFRQLPQFRGYSENQIAQTLYQTMQREQAASRGLAQYQQIFPNLQQYMADRPQYEAWRKAQQAQSQAQQQAAPQQKPKSSWWNPPEVREAYKQYLVKDPETGRDMISPEAPLDARHALTEYQAYKTKFAKDFLEDPEKTLGPMVEDRAKSIAQEIVQQTLKQRDNESFVDSLQAENSDWLFDQQGNVTPEGYAVHKYVEEAKSLGIASPQDRWQYARDKVEYLLLLRDFEARQSHEQQQFQPQPQATQQPQIQQQSTPPQQPDPDAARAAKAQQNLEYLRREAARAPSRSAGTTNTDPRAPKPKMSFEQMLVADAQGRGLI